jgi:hypothetical protein
MSEPNNFGLNKLARLKAERKEQAVKDQALPLDPPFPYEPRRFPFELFGVTEYSDAPPDEV